MGNLAIGAGPSHTVLMGVDQSILDFFWRTAAGAAAVLVIILFAAFGIRRRATLAAQRPRQ